MPVVGRIGDNVRELRRAAFLTQEELAERAEVHLNSIIRIEGNKTEPRASTVRKIAAALGVEPSELVK